MDLIVSNSIVVCYVESMSTDETQKEEALKRQHMDWLSTLMGQQSGRSFALSVGMNPRSFQNFIRREHVTAEGVITISKGLGIDPVVGLIKTGYLPKDYGKGELAPLSMYSMTDLVDEVCRRLPPSVAPSARSFLETASRSGL